jgi:GH24 family phage-related lysozyme (muramidase)/LysM repeat protein
MTVVRFLVLLQVRSWVLLLLTLQTSSSLKDKDMPNYNTQGITSSAGSDPRNLGGSEGYGNPTAPTSSGIMSSTANPTANDDNNDEPSFFESIANLFSGAGADLPSGGSSDDGDSGISFYDSPMFTPYDGGSDDDTAAPSGLPFETTSADRALYEALGVEVPEVYQGTMGEEEPEPNLDMDVLQPALQPEPIIIEELEVKAGDTLSGIAKDKGVSLQSVIDANPQIKNPDMIRPGEVVSVPDPRFEGVPKPRGVADSPRLSEGVADPRKIGDAESTDAPVVAEEAEVDTGTDPRELGGAEGYGSGDTPAEAGLMSPTNLSSRLDSKGLTPVTTTSHAQRRLSDLGYVEVGGADGVAGANTRTAVRRYQQQNGLATTGRLDTPTLESLTGAEADLDTVVQRQIAHHEGKKNYPYKDSRGLWTVGIGHLIGDGTDAALAASEYSEYSESNPMPDAEVTELFEEDLEDHKAIAEGYDFYEGMSKKGKRAIIDLTFNMGDFYNKKNANGDYVWQNLRTQLDAGDWDAAADNLASAAYARQVGQRATTVTDLLRQAGD